MTHLKRTLAGAPAAMIVTTGLGLLMAGLIKVEHATISDKPEQLSFIINETVPEIEVTRITEVPELRTVETPPPPPVIATDPSKMPKTELVTLKTDPPDLPNPTMDWTPASFTVSDRDAQPLFRPPPIMPPNFMAGNNSGHCKVRFDVSPQGSPYNVVTTYCSTPSLKRATVKSVLKWKFRPKVIKGQPVAMNDVENKVTFELLDERDGVFLNFRGEGRKLNCISIREESMTALRKLSIGLAATLSMLGGQATQALAQTDRVNNTGPADQSRQFGANSGEIVLEGQRLMSVDQYGAAINELSEAFVAGRPQPI